MTKTNLEAYKKALADSYSLQVVSALELTSSYFLRNYPTHGYPSQLDFRWVKKEKVKASITFALAMDGKAISLPQCPFGGIWLDETLNSESLELFISAVIAELKRQGIRSIQLTQPPKPYESNQELIQYLLFRMGFMPSGIWSHQFFLGRKKIKKFVQKEAPKFLGKAKDMGLSIRVGPIQNFGFLQNISQWNSKRGYLINFEENRLIQQVSSFPERYFLTSIYQHSHPIAHSLAVKLTPDSLYYYLSATDPKSSAKNLGELMLLQLFQLAVDQKVNFIDLGSSDGPEGANHSLMFFKSRFTNDISNKVTWTLTI